MSPVYSSQPAERAHLVRKLVLLFLLVSVFALGLLLLFREKPDYPVWFQEWFAAVTMAVIAGFGSRWVLRERHSFVRFLMATATYLAGLYEMGLFSNWKYGIGPLEFWGDQVDFNGLAQVGVGLVVFMLIFLAWRRRSSQVLEPVSTSGSRHVIEPDAMPSGQRLQSRSNPPRIRSQNPLTAWFKSRRRSVKVRSDIGRIRNAARSTTNADILVRPKRRQLFRGRPKVQIALVEEHRCPYCPEIVSRIDPRGVVECDVCHTLHHKDCWEITGVCQVPHLNT